MMGVVAPAQIMMMPLSSPGSDGSVMAQTQEKFDGTLFHPNSFLVACLLASEPVCDKCCTVMGNSGGKP